MLLLGHPVPRSGLLVEIYHRPKTFRMIFSRDAVAAKLQSLGNSSAERRQALTGIVLVNIILGVAFLLASLFTSSVWGTTFGFQAMSTAGANLGLNYLVLQWLRQPNVQKLDVLGGAFLVMLLMLLQTTLTWSNLSSGFVGTGMPIPCFISGSGGDHAVSILAGLLFLTNVALATLAFIWKSDWTESSSGSLQYTNLATSTVEAPSDVSIASKTSSKAAYSKTAFVDEDVEGGL